LIASHRPALDTGLGWAVLLARRWKGEAKARIKSGPTIPFDVIGF